MADKETTKGSTSTPKDESAGYSRGENQKPVTETYRKNWDAIFGNKRKTGRKK